MATAHNDYIHLLTHAASLLSSSICSAGPAWPIQRPEGPWLGVFWTLSRIGIHFGFPVGSFLLGEYPETNASTFPAEMPGHSVTRNSDGETQSSVNNGVGR